MYGIVETRPCILIVPLPQTLGGAVGRAKEAERGSQVVYPYLLAR